MKIRIKKAPEMKAGGVFMNYPWAGPLSHYSFGDINTDTSNLDVNINDTIKPIDVKDSNMEAERGEVLFKFDAGGLFKIKGKKHSQGGTPLKADQGDFVFSNSTGLAIDKDTAKEFELIGVTSGKKNNTPAKVLEKNVDIKQYNKFLTVLGNAKSTPIDLKTSELMLAKYMEKIGQVAFVQEMQKDFPQGMPAMSMDTAPVYTEEINDAKTKAKQFKFGGMYFEGGEITYDANGRPIDPHTGDKNKGTSSGTIPFPKGSNKSRYTKAQWEGVMSDLGYTGNKNSNKQFQQFLMQKHPDIVNFFHSEQGFGIPAVTKQVDDNFLGVRWDYIVDAIKRKTPFQPNNLPPLQMPKTVLPKREPTVLDGKIKKNIPEPGKISRNIPSEQYSGPNIGMNGIEGLTTALPGLTAIAQPSFYDMLIQKHSPNIRLDRVDNQAEINDMQQSAALSKREMFGNLDPRVASLVAAGVDGQEAANIMKSNFNKNQQNTQISNQESMINYQADQADNLFNLREIESTYNNNNLTKQRRAEELTNGLVGTVNNGAAITKNLETLNQKVFAAQLPHLTNAYYDAEGQYLGQASDFTDPATGRLNIPDDIQSRIATSKQMPPIQMGRNRLPYFTGFGSLAGVRANTGTQENDVNKALNEVLRTGDNAQKVEAIKAYFGTYKPNLKNQSPQDEMQGFNNPAAAAMLRALLPGG